MKTSFYDRLFFLIIVLIVIMAMCFTPCTAKHYRHHHKKCTLDVTAENVSSSAIYLRWKSNHHCKKFDRMKLLCHGEVNYTDVDGKSERNKTPAMIHYYSIVGKFGMMNKVQPNTKYTCTVSVSSIVGGNRRIKLQHFVVHSSFAAPVPPRRPVIKRNDKLITVTLYNTSSRNGPITGYEVQFHLMNNIPLDENNNPILPEDTYEPLNQKLKTFEEAQSSSNPSSFVWKRDTTVPNELIIDDKKMMGQALKKNSSYVIVTSAYIQEAEKKQLLYSHSLPSEIISFAHVQDTKSTDATRPIILPSFGERYGQRVLYITICALPFGAILVFLGVCLVCKKYRSFKLKSARNRLYGPIRVIHTTPSTPSLLPSPSHRFQTRSSPQLSPFYAQSPRIPKLYPSPSNNSVRLSPLRSPSIKSLPSSSKPLSSSLYSTQTVPPHDHEDTIAPPVVVVAARTGLPEKQSHVFSRPEIVPLLPLESLHFTDTPRPQPLSLTSSPSTVEVLTPLVTSTTVTAQSSSSSFLTPAASNDLPVLQPLQSQPTIPLMLQSALSREKDPSLVPPVTVQTNIPAQLSIVPVSESLSFSSLSSSSSLGSSALDPIGSSLAALDQVGSSFGSPSLDPVESSSFGSPSLNPVVSSLAALDQVGSSFGSQSLDPVESSSFGSLSLNPVVSSSFGSPALGPVRSMESPSVISSSLGSPLSPIDSPLGPLSSSILSTLPPPIVPSLLTRQSPLPLTTSTTVTQQVPPLQSVQYKTSMSSSYSSPSVIPPPPPPPETINDTFFLNRIPLPSTRSLSSLSTASSLFVDNDNHLSFKDSGLMTEDHAPELEMQFSELNLYPFSRPTSPLILPSFSSNYFLAPLIPSDYSSAYITANTSLESFTLAPEEPYYNQLLDTTPYNQSSEESQVYSTPPQSPSPPSSELTLHKNHKKPAAHTYYPFYNKETTAPITALVDLKDIESNIGQQENDNYSLKSAMFPGHSKSQPQITETFESRKKGGSSILTSLINPKALKRILTGASSSQENI